MQKMVRIQIQNSEPPKEFLEKGWESEENSERQIGEMKGHLKATKLHYWTRYQGQ